MGRDVPGRRWGEAQKCVLALSIPFAWLGLSFGESFVSVGFYLFFFSSLLSSISGHVKKPSEIPR